MREAVMIPVAVDDIDNLVTGLQYATKIYDKYFKKVNGEDISIMDSYQYEYLRDVAEACSRMVDKLKRFQKEVENKK